MRLQVEKNGWMIVPWTNRGSAGDRGQGKGKYHGEGRENLLVKMLKLGCSKDSYMEIDARQRNRNSELVLEERSQGYSFKFAFLITI